MSTGGEHFPGPEDGGFEDGPCAICGRPAVRPFLENIEIARGEDHKEPCVCNKCLVDLRGDMATELEVRRQMTNLEAKTQGLEARFSNQNLSLQIVLVVCGFLAGVAATFVFNALIGT